MFLFRRHKGPLADEALLVRLRAGQRAALGEIWDRYAELLYGVAMKYLRDPDGAKDMVLELFAELPELLAKHEVRTFRPWVHQVMRNRCLMLLRKKDPTMAWPEHADQVLGGQEPEEDPEPLLQQLELALEQLNDEQALCLRAFYLEKQSYASIAQRTGMPVDQVRSHLQNGRRNLRKAMEQHRE